MQKDFEILVIDGFLVDLVSITTVLSLLGGWWWFGKEGDGHRGWVRFEGEKKSSVGRLQ